MIMQSMSSSSSSAAGSSKGESRDDFYFYKRETDGTNVGGAERVLIGRKAACLPTNVQQTGSDRLLPRLGSWMDSLWLLYQSSPDRAWL